MRRRVHCGAVDALRHAGVDDRRHARHCQGHPAAQSGPSSSSQDVGLSILPPCALCASSARHAHRSHALTPLPLPSPQRPSPPATEPCPGNRRGCSHPLRLLHFRLADLPSSPASPSSTQPDARRLTPHRRHRQLGHGKRAHPHDCPALPPAAESAAASASAATAPSGRPATAHPPSSPLLVDMQPAGAGPNQCDVCDVCASSCCRAGGSCAWSVRRVDWRSCAPQTLQRVRRMLASARLR